MASRWTDGVAFASLCLIWGSTWLAIRIGLEGAPALLSASLRFGVASLVLLALVALLRSPLPRTRAEWALAGFVGIILFTADYGLIYWAENNGVQSGLAAVLFATMPLQTAVASQAFRTGERLTRWKLGGIAIGFAGILVVFRGELSATGLEKAVPMLAIVGSATCAAISTVAMKRWGHDADPVGFNVVAMGVGAIALAAVSVIAGEAWSMPSWPEGIGSILYLAIFGSVIAFVVYLRLLKRIDATPMSYIALVIPIVAVFLGVSLGNEAFDPVALLGAVLVLGGILLSTRAQGAAASKDRLPSPAGSEGK